MFLHGHWILSKWGSKQVLFEYKKSRSPIRIDFGNIYWYFGGIRSDS